MAAFSLLGENMEYVRKLTCPWCHKGKLMGTSTTNGSVSAKCTKCGRYYIADFTSMITKKANAIPN